MSTVVDATASEDESERASRDPYGGDRIEIDESELRAVSPAAWFEGLVGKLDDLATRLTYGK
ncbi:hypothetical protein ACFQJA_05660 [Halobium salinum]